MQSLNSCDADIKGGGVFTSTVCRLEFSFGIHLQRSGRRSTIGCR